MQIHLAKAGEKLGPFSFDEVQAKLAAGEIAETDLAWREGLPEWVPLNSFLSIPPPLPPQAIYFYIPVGRLVGLSIATLNLFQIYWFYRNWRYVKTVQGLEIMPFWRAVFGIFFVASLFTRIRKNAAARSLRLAPFSDMLAPFWILLSVGTNISSRFMTEPLPSIISLVIALSTVFLLVPVQRYVNAINEASNPPPPHAPWSTGHTVVLIFGVFFWLLVLAGIAAAFLHLDKA